MNYFNLRLASKSRFGLFLCSQTFMRNQKLANELCKQAKKWENEKLNIQ